MKRFKARIIIKLKSEIRDSQAEAVEMVLKNTGIEKDPEINVLRGIDFEFSANNIEEAQEKLKNSVEKVFSNPVLEECEIQGFEELK